MEVWSPALWQCQLRLAAAHDLPPRAQRQNRHGARQRLAFIPVRRRGRDPQEYHQRRSGRLYRGNADAAFLYDPNPRFALVPRPEQEAKRENLFHRRP